MKRLIDENDPGKHGINSSTWTESHPIRSLHLRCGDSEVGSRGTVIASEHSERAFEPGGMQRIKLPECNDRMVAA